MGKDCDFEKNFDDALSEALNEYIVEESSVASGFQFVFFKS